MGEQQFLHTMLRIAIRETSPGSARAEAILSWCNDNGTFLFPPDPAGASARVKGKKAGKGRKKRKDKKRQARWTWKRLGKALAKPAGTADAPTPAPMIIARRLARVLDLGTADARLLEIAVAFNRLRRASSLAWRLRSNGMDDHVLACALVGFETADAIYQSQAMRLGLVELSAGRNGEISIDLADAMDRVLRRAPVDDAEMIACLVGPQATTALALSDFAGRSDAVDLVRRILAGGLQAGAAGINILLYGPPGTGKTELAKVLAQAAGARLLAVGEVDEYGDEPTRWDRVTALKLAQRVLASRNDTVLLFDEMEDLIGDVQLAAGGSFFSRRDGSKVFLNRLFESNPVPTLWTSNAIENIDPAFLRRMSFVMKMDVPSPAERARIIGRIAEAEDMSLANGDSGGLAELAPEAVTVARNAIRSARLAGGGDGDAGRIAEALVTGIRHGRRVVPSSNSERPLDLDLYEAPQPIDTLVERLSGKGAPADFSLLLTGPPGTGKTALAGHLARALDRPLVIKRASDLLSKWVGEAEKQIADAFAEAAERGHVLLFDEIDSLLFDRASATRSWEVSQVNELLTWMDNHPMPFIAATNHADKLDPAAMRRFTFKIELKPLSASKAAHAFRRFFDAEPPASLNEIDGLTPGDFAVVARQLRFQCGKPGAGAIVGLLAGEAAVKPGRLKSIGFTVPGRAVSTKSGTVTTK